MPHPPHLLIATPIGEMILIATDTGLAIAAFTDGNVDRMIRKQGAIPETTQSRSHLAAARDELKAYFAGALTAFTVPLAPHGTPFQKAAWEQLCAIPHGETRSYAQQAIAVGNSAAVRAVAGANGRNPICVIVPCHRVIGSDGSLTGFGAGVWRKRWLLDHERAFGAPQLFSAATDGRMHAHCLPCANACG